MDQLTATTDRCPVCLDGAAAKHPVTGDFETYTCRRCGEFTVNGSAIPAVTREVDHERRLLSSWISEQSRTGICPVISTDSIARILRLVLPTVQERADSLLLAVAGGADRLGERFDIQEPRLVSATWSLDTNEVAYLVQVLAAQGMLKFVALGGSCEITPAGYLRLDDLRRRQAASGQAFVAMWFDASLSEAYERGIAVGIRDAGYRPLRVDSIEHAGKIDDEIVAQIRRSRFVVADFTGHRGGVYFEAGFGQGLGLPIIWTCRADSMDGLHFDIRQFNCIDWKDPLDLARRLQLRIEAVIGRGPESQA